MGRTACTRRMRGASFLLSFLPLQPHRLPRNVVRMDRTQGLYRDGGFLRRFCSVLVVFDRYLSVLVDRYSSWRGRQQRWWWVWREKREGRSLATWSRPKLRNYRIDRFPYMVMLPLGRRLPRSPRHKRPLVPFCQIHSYRLPNSYTALSPPPDPDASCHDNTTAAAPYPESSSLEA